MRLFAALAVLLFSLNGNVVWAFDSCHDVFERPWVPQRTWVEDEAVNDSPESESADPGNYELQRTPRNQVRFKGSDALRRENEQVHSIVRALRLTREQQRILHDEITGRHLSRSEILEIAKDLFQSESY